MASGSAAHGTVATTPPVRLFWTGGWDSTYRLLWLVLVEGRHVEPIYLVDEGRRSLHVERRTMQHLRERLAELEPRTRALLLPTWEVSVAGLAPDPDITQAFHRILRRYAIGTQYEWIARFCRQYDVRDVEMGSEHSPHGASLMLRDFAGEARTPTGERTYVVLPEHLHTDVGLLFGAYRFPLIKTTKHDMAREAARLGWTSLLADTWFCHHPLRGKPCGTCNPCQGVIDEGFGWRMPRSRRALAYLHRATIGPVKKRVKRALARRR